MLAMLLKYCLILLWVFSCGSALGSHGYDHRKSVRSSNFSTLPGIELPVHMSFNAVSSSNNGCNSFSSSNQEAKSQNTQKRNDSDSDSDSDSKSGTDSGEEPLKTVKLQLKHKSTKGETEPRKTVVDYKIKDLIRIQTLHRRITEKKNQNTNSRQKKTKLTPSIPPASTPESSPTWVSDEISGQMIATLGSGVTLGSGEYFMDVFIGTPPKHFSLILDTGSDLNWIQCVPCYDCFDQTGPYYDPKQSSSFKNISCKDPKCNLVSSPDPPQVCKSDTQTCPYYYWYGDSSNTTGDFATETFTVNLTHVTSELKQVDKVMFGCGHWNRGLFHGAAGLLGLGKGPLSFSSQLQSLYGHSFSYCLVDRNSDTNITSKLIFGEDKQLLSNPDLNFTKLVDGKENPVDTFYYLNIKSIVVGGEPLPIPEETWRVSSSDGSGGTIIDSGTTLSYFAEPGYEMIKKAFAEKVKGYHDYPVLKDFPILNPCYNVSGVEKIELPEFGIVFKDGAVWNFPVENYFILIEEDVVCLAILGTPKSGLSIIGNYQQQNFHILYDTKKSRLGYAPVKCADV